VVRTIQNDPTLQPSTKHQYIKTIENYLATGESLTDPQALTEYALTVGSSTRSFLAAAVTRMAQELEQLAKGSATPDNIAVIQAAVFRTQALQNAIKIQQPKGEKAHAWLAYHEAERLLEACNRRRNGKKEFEILHPAGPFGHWLDDGRGASPRRGCQPAIYGYHQAGQALCAECDRERR